MKTEIIVHLEIEGDPVDAYYVVDKVLDAGVFQDAINYHEFTTHEALRVTDASIQGRRIIKA